MLLDSNCDFDGFLEQRRDGGDRDIAVVGHHGDAHGSWGLLEESTDGDYGLLGFSYDPQGTDVKLLASGGELQGLDWLSTSSGPFRGAYPNKELAQLFFELLQGQGESRLRKAPRFGGPPDVLVFRQGQE